MKKVCQTDRPTSSRKKVILTLLTMTLALGTLASSFIQSGTAYGAEGTVSIRGEVQSNTDQIAVWKAWIKQHAQEFTSIQPEKLVNGSIPKQNFDDLDKLKTLLQDKRIVYLGESTHSTAEFSLAKTRLIQYLHQELGYSRVAFESALSDAAMAQGRMNSRTPQDTLSQALNGVYITEEVLQLFEYIKSTQGSSTPLRLTGFDMKMDVILEPNATWIQGQALREKLIKAEQDIKEWMIGKRDLASFQKAKPELIALYQRLNEELPKYKDFMQKDYPNEPQIYQLIKRAIEVRLKALNEYYEQYIDYLQKVLSGSIGIDTAFLQWRDKQMADNLVWLATEVYPNEKLIVWAHNTHIGKATHELYEGEVGQLKYVGELMPKELQAQSYVIGLYMASGEIFDWFNNGIHKVLPLLPGSIEDILSSSGKPYTFMDIRYSPPVVGNEWMSRPTKSYEEGRAEHLLVPKNNYDGLILIDKVQIPHFLK